ncbi:hypothetical protein DI396_01995 [Litorivita pollutaquae]|uniref:DUF4174 domain-containing protein n=1 Tax=Litorivita pollutaquae TaxID=2200892 RepID=A0A2V4MX69_9RHOB|nr:DUF4174 domain-containing protein [Litorivita pollutaquae]OUS20688.1 hypothetical protein A9Q95_10290 [Rhodobacterales bacterium 59_46_T64]PYC48878.1 hypothetical protein DI396_01995 [Litorivita pollutaquae]
MKPLLAFVLMVLCAPAVAAQDTPEPAVTPVIDAGDVDNLSEFKWIKRPLVIFSDSPFNPDFMRQMTLLAEGVAELAARDVVVITDTDPAAATSLREELRPRGFALVLIGKDGGVKLRKPVPWDVRELSRSIDKMPLRQQELKR